MTEKVTPATVFAKREASKDQTYIRRINNADGTVGDIVTSEEYASDPD
jgi:hypothetical protein